MYEPHHAPLLSHGQYLRRLAGHFLVAIAIVSASLLVGMEGYRYYEGLEWRDAFLDAAMLLGGEGPIHQPRTPGGKVFAGLYALYAGIVFIVVAGIIVAPVVHRVAHRFHLADEESETKKRR